MSTKRLLTDGRETVEFKRTSGSQPVNTSSNLVGANNIAVPRHKSWRVRQVVWRKISLGLLILAKFCRTAAGSVETINDTRIPRRVIFAINSREQALFVSLCFSN